MAKKPKASKRRRKNRVKKNRDKRSTESVAYELLEPKHLLAAITVGNTTDLSNAPDTSSITALIANNGGDGISLREAIAAANNTVGEDSITFDGSVFTGGDNSVIRLTQGQLPISNSLSIDGTSVGGVVITGDANDDDVTVGGSHITDVSASFGGTAGAAGDLLDDNSRVLNVSGTANLTLTDLTITGGRTTGQVQGGAGIRFSSSGTLTLNDSTVSGNSTTGELSSGGGIITISGDVSLVNSTVSGNSTAGELSQGGGVRNISGAVSLVNSTLSGNSTTGDSSDGGGIANYSGDVSLINSTLSGNSTAGIGSDGGGIWTFRSAVEMVNSTVTGNSTSGFGGGISFDASSNGTERLTLHNTIVAGNTDSGFAPDVEAVGNVMTNLIVENSLIGDLTGAGFTLTHLDGNIVNRDPLLGPLADNGGPTQTHALMSDSLGINAGSNLLAAGLLTDQRGEDRILTGTVDIGSYESPIIVVTTASDTVDATDSETSLREAINLANNSTELDTITFFPSVFTFGTRLIRLTQGELVISETLSIDATAAGGVVITGDANDDDETSFIGITDVSASLSADLLDDNSRVLNVSGTGNLTLTGLTITGGRTAGSRESGGGVRFYSSGALTLNDSTVSGNSTNGDLSSGGGIFSSSGDVTLVNSTLSGNSTAGIYSAILGGSASFGGGISAVSGDVSLVNSTLSGNSTNGGSSFGGGISTGYGDVSLLNSTLSGNSTTGYSSGGGGIHSSGVVSLVNSTLSGNSTTGRGSGGGGIHTSNFGEVFLLNSTLSGNSNTGFGSAGGGISNSLGAISLVNSTLSGNRNTGDDSDGGGIYTNGAVSLVNSTLTGNSTVRVGGGISFRTFDPNFTSPPLTLHNAIVAGNTDNGPAPDVAVANMMNDLIVENSLIGDTTGSGITSTTGTGNILNQDPLLGPLANNGAPTLTHALLFGSPAIDAGNDLLAVDANGAALGTDQRGGNSTRIFDDVTASGASVDIGAFELRSVLVDNQIDENDGIITAGNLSLREAIGLAEFDTITFDPSVFTGGDNSVIRLTQGELVIRENLSIDATSVGGVVITGDANDDDVTVGGSQITDVSASFGGAAGDLLDDNSRVLNVMYGGSYDVSLTLTGLTITGGRTTRLYDDGGGIDFNSRGALTLNDSTLSGNSTTGDQSRGGGIAGSSDVTLVNSTLSGNSTSRLGGGIFTFGDVTLVNSTLSGNNTTIGGGGGIGAGGDVTLDNSTLSGNSGGGISAFSGDVSLVNSTLSDNSGGGVITTSGAVSLVNSTLSDNSTRSDGGGILTGSGDVSLVNSTVSGNSTTGFSTDGGGVFTSSGDVSLTNSTLSDNSTTGGFSGGGGIRNISGAVSLVNSTVTGNSALGVGGGISFGTSDSPDTSGLTLHNSIVAGNTDNGTAPDVEAVGDVTNDLIVENSLIGDTTGSGITTTTGTGNILNEDPLLGPLADNGGPTLTHTLLPGSPAIDGGSNALALDENGNPLTTDQRGETRIESGTVDIGAVESEFVAPFVLGDADLDGDVDFADIPAFIDVLLSGTFLDEADVNRDGIVDFADIPAFIDALLSGGSSAVTSQSVVVASPISSAASLVSAAESEEAGGVDLFDETFSTYEDDLDVVFS